MPKKIKHKFVTVILVITMPILCNAGIIFDFEKGNGKLKITEIEIEQDRISITEENGTKNTFQLPFELIKEVFLWAMATTSNKTVVSIDGALDSTGNQSDLFKTYTAPELGSKISIVLNLIDRIVSSIACGYLPAIKMNHPLYRVDKSLLPAAQHQNLLSEDNYTKDAIDYKNLARLFPSPPKCVGETTIRVSTDKQGVSVEPRIWTYHLFGEWVENNNEIEPKDDIISKLPFRFLTTDIEKNWDKYGESFYTVKQFTELAKLMGLLKHAAENNYLLFTRTLNNYSKELKEYTKMRDRLSTYEEYEKSFVLEILLLSSDNLLVENWNKVHRAWLDSISDNASRIRQELRDFASKNYPDIDHDNNSWLSWREKNRETINNNPDIYLKVLLAEFKFVTRQVERSELTKKIIDKIQNLEKDENGFKLSFYILSKLLTEQRSLDDEEAEAANYLALTEILAGELRNFVKFSKSLKTDGRNVKVAVQLETLSSALLNTNILPTVIKFNRNLSWFAVDIDEFWVTVAHVLYNRTYTNQEDARQYSLNHFVYRILERIEGIVETKKSKKAIAKLKLRLAGKNGLQISTLNAQLSLEFAPNHIEGKLVSSSCVDNKKNSQCNSVEQGKAGVPVGIIKENRFIPLIFNTKNLYNTCQNDDSRAVRARGLLLDDGSAFSVRNMEVNCNNSWKNIKIN